MKKDIDFELALVRKKVLHTYEPYNKALFLRRLASEYSWEISIDHYYTYKESQNQTFGTILNPTVPKEVVYSKYFVEE